MRGEGMLFREIADGFGYEQMQSAWLLHRRAERWLATMLSPLEPAPTVECEPLSDTFIAWAAGFFDGEGCIYASESEQGGYRRFTFVLQVAQVRREPLDALSAAWGGSVRGQQPRNPRHQFQWQWGLRGRKAAQFLSDVLPYLRVKAEPARAAIPCLERVHAHGAAYTDEEIVGRRAAIAVIRAANRRGEAVV
jgi:hypothetical protein